MDKILTKPRSLFDYIPGNFFFYYKLLKPIIKIALSKQNNSEYYHILYASKKITDSCLRTGVKIHLKGLKNLNKTPRIIIANHMSSLETLILPYITESIGQISFVVKQELFKKIMFKNIMQKMKCIPITRTNPKQDLKTIFSKGEQLLNEGISIIIFPQKTRNIKFIPKEFNSLGNKLAIKLNVPIQTLALKTDFMTSSKLIKDFGCINRKKDIYFHFDQIKKVTKDNQQQIHKESVIFLKKNIFI